MKFTKEELNALLNEEKPLQLGGLDLSKSDLHGAELSKATTEDRLIPTPWAIDPPTIPLSDPGA